MGVKDIGDNVRRHMKIRSMTIPQLADKVGMGTAAISNMLNGKSEPKSSTLIELAKALDVSFEELLADTPSLRSLRFRTGKTLSGREKAERDQLKHDTAIWLADYRFLEAELKDYQEYRLDSITAADPSIAAAAVREVLNISSNQPIHNISQLISQAGIKLRIRPFGFKRTFGLSVGPVDGGPAIVTNAEQGITVERQIFTIAHELGHIILHKGSYSPENEDIDNDEEESQANRFAGELLVPTIAFKNVWDDAKGLPWIDRVLHAKKHFKVSYETILIRLKQIDPSLADRNLMVDYRIGYKNKYHHDFKDHYEPNALDSFDLIEDRFSGLVRSAYEQEIISIGRAGEMLNLSLEDMRAMIREWQAL